MPTESIPLIYEKRLVAFIDVMGFKELLFARDETFEALKAYYNTVAEFLDGKSSVYSTTAPDDSFKKLLVSDSVILSVLLTEDSEENIKRASRFFSTIGLLQYMLAFRSKIWTRGAVSVGDLYIDEESNILVGPAFVQAYELEKFADYPRVVIDPKVFKFFGFSPNTFIEKINTVGFQGRLMGVNAPPRYDIAPFINDAVQIDWFRQAFDRTEQLGDFFDDLAIRQNQSQDLFEKSTKLIRYLKESLFVAKEETNYPRTTNNLLGSRLDQISVRFNGLS